MGKSDLGFLTFFMNAILCANKFANLDLINRNNFIGIISFYLVYSYNSLLIGISLFLGFIL